ncbi:MAG: DAK2 domain-containing protein [Actinomycetota bacterium]|nr:DAK2 domain-containing protein [Actinomycetota bacterium]
MSDPSTGTDLALDRLVSVVDDALAGLAEHREHLRDLDAAVGDGDLGITIDKGSQAVRVALAAAPPDSVSALLRSAGAAFAKANPSTMAALVGAGLLAAAKAVEGETTWSSTVAEAVGRAAATKVADRGKAEPGDKTVLDAVWPSLDALRDAPVGQGLAAMVDAAQSGLDATTGRGGRRGRAAWVGERGAGHPDPGATAYVLLLQELRRATQQA